MQNNYGSICDAVAKLKNKYKQTDPFKLCEAMGISVLLRNMGSRDGACKGFFLKQSRIRCITINSALSPVLQRIICAHELGHAILHQTKTGIKAFHDFAMFDENTQNEKEANVFAAELLLDDEAVNSALNEDITFFQAASILLVPIELLDFKFRVMKWKGYKLMDPPITASSDFIRSLNALRNNI